MNLRKAFYWGAFCAILFVWVPTFAAPWNNPYPKRDAEANYFYTSFSERPKHLDPARSYSSDEWGFIGQIYEPPLEYHYLKRPYTLIPLLLTKMPTVKKYDAAGRLIKKGSNRKVAYTTYDLEIKKGVRYQPHPAFARDKSGKFLYIDIPYKKLIQYDHLNQFAVHSTRELTADDFVYQIKRLADPANFSPVYSLMAKYIDGLKALGDQLYQEREKRKQSAKQDPYLDLRQYLLKGVKALDKYHYQIRIKGEYAQFIYWLAMPFFAPMPWEADKFYAQPALKKRNITLDWYPVGTGPYLLSENNPNLRMVLKRNPNFRGDVYPNVGTLDDKAKGVLDRAGESIPFIDKVIFTLDKEVIPNWNKFLQGYYDQSGISSDSFDQALQASGDGGLALTESMKEKGIRLNTASTLTTMYWGFNMLDKTIGGYSEKARKLRQAISIAVDIEEFISIFLNDRGVVAQDPLPEGIFGALQGKAGLNPVTHEWRQGGYHRRSISVAKRLLKEAGYPNGRDAKTGKPLVIYFDTVASGGPSTKAQLDWMRKQFKKLNLQLQVGATQYNRFKEKVRTGNVQLFMWGWNADYPDPENFLFLLYGPNGEVKHGGANAVNYNNPAFNRLFNQMRNMENKPQRQRIISQMMNLLHKDAPWIFGYHPKAYALSHHWIAPTKPNVISRGTMKYLKLDPSLRASERAGWNQPIMWPAYLMLGLLLLGVYLQRRSVKDKER